MHICSRYMHNMLAFSFYVLCVVLLASAKAEGEVLTSVQSKLDQVSYLYPNQVREERQLPDCTRGDVCSTEHHRYWLPTWVRRYCRCPTSDCSEKAGSLDNRSLIKVCTSERDHLSSCREKEIGLEATSTAGEGSTVSVYCRCPWPSYWALVAHLENSTLTHDKYICQMKLKKCHVNEFCGHIRTDTYSMYVQCACPHNHLCLNRDRIRYNVSEALYQGPAMRAYCLPFERDD